MTEHRDEPLRTTMMGHVDSGEVPGLAWLVSHDGDVFVGAAGVLDVESARPVARNSIFRISSVTKPITAACAMTLVDDRTLSLDEPVTDLLPELADRQVLASPGGPLDQTVAAEREITLRDLLTFRLGLGADFSGARQPAIDRAVELGLPFGAPSPAHYPAPDEYMAILAQVPLEYQPGERWLYDLGADVLGVLVSRACSMPFGAVVRERILDPIGMADTGFCVPPGDLDRLGAVYWTSPSGERGVFDPPDGQWSTPPRFGGGASGLVSTLDDLHAFASMLRDGGRWADIQLLSEESVVEMTTNQLSDDQMGSGPGNGLGWGLGMGVQTVESPVRSVGAFGWDGGLGSVLWIDPNRDLIVILLANQAWTSPEPTGVFVDVLREAARLSRR